ncbi:V-type proton ATPase subunit S1 [Anopheles arabiensis]|uniref:AGAP003879-PA n=3 Tax=gambiae species complex TaxID=44542 RepID=Q7QFR7_ANOGA|nr:V-type proton ATPase subunit S1 [Anopheles arabiensis]EAA06051.5 AGAP003879-PA [Anopheles gambiae str. PEST]
MAKLGVTVTLFLALAVFGSARAANVPVFVWGKPSVTYVPALSLYSSSEFGALVEAQIDEKTFTIVFAEDRLSAEDLSQCKLKTQTCFKNLQKLERKSYLPSVEEPLSVLEGSNAQSVQLRPDGTLSERIVPQAGGIVVVNLSGDDFASHDALIDALYARLHKEHPNIVAIYTGKTPSFSYSSLVRKTRQAGQEPEPAKVELKTDGFLMVYEKFMFGQADAAELTVAQLGEATKVENATTDVVQIRLTGAGAQVDLFFLLTQGSWEITGVWFDNQEYYLRHRVHVNQHFSYSCNQWEYYSYDLQKKIVFEEVQLQPFWPGADGVAPPNNRFGDAWYCVGFTTGGILSGLFLVLIFIIIGSYGIAWMMDIRTMDRFDDPKGKTITVNAAE